MYDVLSQISYLANALTIIRKRIFKLQISNFLAARARLFASESSYLKFIFIRSLRSLRTVGTVGTFFYYLNEVLSREKHQLGVFCVVIDWSNKSNGSDRTDGYF